MHLASPLLLTVNRKLKEFDKAEFSTLSKIIAANPNIDLADVRVDTKLSSLKRLRTKAWVLSYELFRSNEGKMNILSGWHAAGSSKAVSKNLRRETGWNSVLTDFRTYELKTSVSY